MKTYSTIWAYLWDLEDEGIEEAVRRYGIAPRPCLDWIKYCTERSSGYIA